MWYDMQYDYDKCNTHSNKNTLIPTITDEMWSVSCSERKG